MKTNRPLFITLLAVLALASLAACSPASPQPQAVMSTQPAYPPASSPDPVKTAYPAPQASSTITEPASAPSAEPIELPSPMPEPAEPWVSYIGADENLWITNPARGEMRQVTTDAQAIQPGMLTIQYCCAVWSTDGQYLAYQRQVGTPVAEGLNYEFGLWVFDLASGQSREVLAEQMTAGFAWQPGTHNLTYGKTIPTEYFATRGSVDPAYAAGIWAVDVDAGTNFEMVKPERGFSLVNPNWSPDGRFMGFDEVYLMEGRGNFSYYDFTAQQYNAWDKAIGSYVWSPDGETLYYDYLTYAPSGTERIFRNNRQNTDEQQISPDMANGYASSPLLLPDGSQVIYVTEEMLGEGRSHYQMIIQPAAGGDTSVLGEFEQPGEFSISPDSSTLLLTTGPWDSRQIQLLTIADGSARALLQGRQPKWQPAATP